MKQYVLQTKNYVTGEWEYVEKNKSYRYLDFVLNELVEIKDLTPDDYRIIELNKEETK